MSLPPSIAVFVLALLAPTPAQERAPAEDAGPRLTLRVFDAARRPVAGATVLRTMSLRGRGSPELLLSGRQFPLGGLLDRVSTGADGTCHVDLPPPVTYAFAPPRSVLFVRAPGHALRAVPIPRDAMPPGPRMEVVLARQAPPAAIRILTPDGEPAAGVLVRAIGVDCGDGIALLPDECVAEARTDDRGAVRFPAIEGVATVEVRHERLGTQVATRLFEHGLDGVKLKPAAPFELVVEARGDLRAAAVAGQRLRLWTVPPQRGGQSPSVGEEQVMGYLEATFDAEGRIRCAALANGQVTFEPVGDPGSAVVPALRWGLQHPPDGGRLSLQPARVREVRGRVIDAETRRGVPDASVLVSGNTTMRRLTTDAEGGFIARVYGDVVRIGLARCPARYLSLTADFGRVVKSDVRELPPFELRRGEVLSGRVVAGGEGVGGAFVVAEWKEKARFGESTRRRWAFSAGDGRFRIAGVTPGVGPRLTAHADRGRSAETTANPQGETLLEVVTAATIRLSGVLRRDGQGLAGVPVSVERQIAPTGRTVGGAKQEPAGITATTDAAGRYECRVPAGPDYRIAAGLDGHAPGGSAWQRSRDEGITLDLKLRRLVTCNGRVVRGDVPVAGATITCPARGVSARTGADGAFALAGVPEGSLLLVVEATGVAGVDRNGGFHARRVSSGAVLDLAVPQPRRSAPLLPLEQRLTLARNVLGGSVREQEAAGAFGKDLRLWQALAGADPGATFLRLETEGLDVAWYGDAVRRELILAVDFVDPVEALSLCETLDGEDRRALNLARLARNRRPAEARRVLGEALLSARRIDAPDMRLCVLSRIGEGFLDAGDSAAALRVFEEAEPLVGELPNKEWPGYARACFATDTAVLDLPRSLKIVEGMNKQEQDRHFANIAHELAAKDPEASEQVLGRVSEWARDRAAPRVCQRMVTADAERARRIADRVREPAQRAFTLAAMAVPLRSAALIDAALKVAQEQGRSPTTFAGILHFVAEAAPQRLGEVIGRAVAARHPRSTDPRAAWQLGLREDCTVAMHLALYDVDLAREVLAEAVAARGFLLSDRNQYEVGDLFRALALVEPHLAVQVVEDIADDHPQESYRLRPRARQVVAGVLACRTRAQLLKQITGATLEEDQ